MYKLLRLWTFNDFKHLTWIYVDNAEFISEINFSEAFMTADFIVGGKNKTLSIQLKNHWKRIKASEITGLCIQIQVQLT